MTEKGEKFLRMMQPLVTEEGCLKCHGHQGYAVGDIRGGVSVAVPMQFFREHEQKGIMTILASYCLLWGIGLFASYFFINRLQTVARQRAEIQQIAEKHDLLTTHHEQLKATNKELQNALKEIKTLRGIIPICSYCKKIRDDKGAWDIIEAYICDHSEAQFSHGVCPDCYKKQMEQME